MMQAFWEISGKTPRALVIFGSDGDEGSRERTPSASKSARECLVGLRVLIVEDEALISLEFEDTFARLGMEAVGTAQTADEALHLAAVARPDFLTVDVSIRGERDGVSAATEIYRRFGLRSIFVTAYGDQATVDRGRPANPLGWIAKPVSGDDLARMLPSLLADILDD